MNRLCYFDCFSGISGDMILAALIDLGLDFKYLEGELKKLKLSGYTIKTSKVMRCSLSGTRFEVEVQKHKHQHRSLSNILTLIDKSSLNEQVKEKASSMFRRLGQIEANIHRTAVDKVTLHEVGAVDSIIDIVGIAIGLQLLEVDEFCSSPINVGSGTVECQHGTLPVPSPATAELLKGIPIYSSGPECELTTPTGALVLASYAKSFGPMPQMIVEKIGYGAGKKDFPHFPNLLRIFVGKRDSSSLELQEDEVVLIEANIDDMSPQNFGYCQERLFDQGALEVFFTPVIMKKNRPATMLTVISPLELRDKICEIIFQETTTIGLRYYHTQRKKLIREPVLVNTPYGQVEIKVARWGDKMLNYTPEFESCSRIAREKKISLKEIQNQALLSFLKLKDKPKR